MLSRSTYQGVHARALAMCARVQEFTIGEIKSVDSNDAPSRVTLCIPAVFKADSGKFSRRTEDLKLELGAEDIEDVEGDIEEIEGKFLPLSASNLAFYLRHWHTSTAGN